MASVISKPSSHSHSHYSTTNPLFSSSKFHYYLHNNASKFYAFPSKSTISVTLTHPPSRATNDFHSFSTQESDPVMESDIDPTRDRRRVVRVAWEKLVRWSRSWRSKSNTDVLQRTNKVYFLPFQI